MNNLTHCISYGLINTFRWLCIAVPIFVLSVNVALVRYFLLKPVDTIGNYQRLAFTVGVSQHLCIK